MKFLPISLGTLLLCTAFSLSAQVEVTGDFNVTGTISSGGNIISSDYFAAVTEASNSSSFTDTGSDVYTVTLANCSLCTKFYIKWNPGINGRYISSNINYVLKDTNGDNVPFNAYYETGSNDGVSRDYYHDSDGAGGAGLSEGDSPIASGQFGVFFIQAASTVSSVQITLSLSDQNTNISGSASPSFTLRSLN